MNIWSKQIRLEIDNASHSVLDKRWNTSFQQKKYRLLPFSRLYLPKEGMGLAQYNGRDYVLRPGRMLLIPAFADAYLSCDKYLEKYWVHFNAYEEKTLIDIFSFFPDCMEYDIPPEKLQMYLGLFQHMIEILSGNDISSELITFTTHSLLSIMLEPFFHKLAGNESPDILPLLFKVIVYMQHNLANPINMKELGRIAGKHPNYLSRIFRNLMGLPPIQYMKLLRYQTACRLLYTENLTIGEIAERTGYANVSSFSKMFRRYTGMSPRAVRKHRILH